MSDENDLRCLRTAAIEACTAGLGFDMFLSYQVAPYLAGKALKVVLKKFEQPPRPINLTCPSARLLPARTKILIDWLKRELRDIEEPRKWMAREIPESHANFLAVDSP